jgi:C2 domain
MKGHDDDLPDADYDHLWSSDDKGVDCKNKKSIDNEMMIDDIHEEDQIYILGTLIVRIVAARDLPAATTTTNGGLGDFLFGGGKGSCANPYASVNFGSSTQRTCPMYETRNPVWPRGESMYMDVTLPLGKTTFSPAATVVDQQHQKQPVSSTTTRSSLPKNQLDESTLSALDLPRPVLTVAIFSANDNNRGGMPSSSSSSLSKYPSKKNKAKATGDSDDEFLGVTQLDLTALLTGKRCLVDDWLPLMSSTSGSVRVVCEYEPSDIPPSVGDKVQFTRFCHPADLFPINPSMTYAVEGVVDRDRILLGHTSPEGWTCSFVVHRHQVICMDRRQYNAVEVAKEEWQSITERLSHSPLVETVTHAVEQFPEEGLFGLGASTLQGGALLLGRWLEGGVDAAVKDVAFATNWDGRFNPGSDEVRQRSLDNNNTDNNDEAPPLEQEEGNGEETKSLPMELSLSLTTAVRDTQDVLPNMPCCPITGEPMVDPVVAVSLFAIFYLYLLGFVHVFPLTTPVLW